MSDFDKAFNYMMDNEDAGRTGVITSDPTHDDPNALARFGINSAAHPELIPGGYFDASKVPSPAALLTAEDTYKYCYFVPIGGYSIVCQDIANKFFDLAVNSGTEEATKIVQRACNQVLHKVAIGYMPLTIDGVCGAQTREAINACAPEELLPVIKAYASDFYRAAAFRLHWPTRELAELLSRVQK